MKHFVTLLTAAGISASLFALNELGPLADARRQHPSVFVSNCALEYVVGGKPCYVYGGESRQRFKGDAAIKDSVLFREAERRAKMNLYRFLTKGDKSLAFEMSGALCMYSFKEDNTAKAIYFVPKGNVRVSQRKAPAPAPSPASAPAAGASAPAAGEDANARVYAEINNAAKTISQTHVVSVDVNMPTNQGSGAKFPEPQFPSTPSLNSGNNLTNSPDVKIDMPDPFKNMPDPFKNNKAISGTPNNAEKSLSNAQEAAADVNVPTSQVTCANSPEQKPASTPNLNSPGNQTTNAPGVKVDMPAKSLP